MTCRNLNLSGERTANTFRKMYNFFLDEEIYCSVIDLKILTILCMQHLLMPVITFGCSVFGYCSNSH